MKTTSMNSRLIARQHSYEADRLVSSHARVPRGVRNRMIGSVHGSAR